MIITKETDYALRILRVLLDGEKHSVAGMSETELIPNQFAYQILRKLSAGNLVRVSRGALGGCELSCDLTGDSGGGRGLGGLGIQIVHIQAEDRGHHIQKPPRTEIGRAVV